MNKPCGINKSWMGIIILCFCFITTQSMGREAILDNYNDGVPLYSLLDKQKGVSVTPLFYEYDTEIITAQCGKDLFPKQMFRQGRDHITFRVESSRDGYLTLLEVKNNDKIIVIFPNRLEAEKSFELKADIPHICPSTLSLVASRPLGEYWVWGIVTPEPINLDRFDQDSDMISIPWKSKDTFILWLVNQLNRMDFVQTGFGSYHCIPKIPRVNLTARTKMGVVEHRRGNTYFDAGLFEKAQASFFNVYKQNPHTALYAFGVADCYFEMQRFEDAKEWYKKGLKYQNDVISQKRVREINEFLNDRLEYTCSQFARAVTTRSKRPNIPVIIEFELNRADIRPESKKKLDRLIQFFKRDKINTMKFEIQGHTCARGTAQYNQVLSNERANAVKRYLIDKGLDKTRLEAVGYGETKLKDPAFPESASNRRVEFKEILEQ